MTKTTDLRPCDNCGGPIAPFFYRVEIKFRQVMIDPRAVNQVLGTAQILGSLELGAIMAPNRDVLIESPAYRIDKDIWLCQSCTYGLESNKPFKIDLVQMMIEHEREETRP